MNILHPNLIYEILKQSDYPTIINIRLSDVNIDNLCNNDTLFKKLIINKNVEFLLQNYSLDDALVENIMYGNVRVTHALIKKGANFNNLITLALTYVSQIGNVKEVNKLLKYMQADPSDNNNQAFIASIRNQHLDVVELLLEDNRLNPSNNNNEAIILACLYGYLNIVNCLLKDNRVDPSSQNNLAIRLAQQNGHIDVVNRLLEDPRVQQNL